MGKNIVAKSGIRVPKIMKALKPLKSRTPKMAKADYD